MSKAGNYVYVEVDRIVNYCRLEFDASYAEVVGCLFIKAHELSREAVEREHNE